MLIERLCNDFLEQYFGNQIRTGWRNDISDLKEFGHNDINKGIQFNLSITFGNTKDWYDSILW